MKLNDFFQKKSKVSPHSDEKIVRENGYDNCQLPGPKHPSGLWPADDRAVSSVQGQVSKNVALKDQVSISPESKNRLNAEKIANQLISQFGNGNGPSDTSREILNRLNREYGQILKFEAKEGQGLVFKVSDETKPQGSPHLSLEEMEELQKNYWKSHVRSCTIF